MKKLSIGIIGLLACLLAIGACSSRPEIKECGDLPPLYPDYAGVTIPPNIAPLNFLLRNDPEAMEVRITGTATDWTVKGGKAVRFPLKKWREMLEREKGKSLQVQVTAQKEGRRIRYASFGWEVAADRIDPYLSYRLIEPGYEVWNALQLRERNLESFAERVIADNNLTEGSCMNCHIYGRQNPAVSFFHLRGAKGGTVLNRNGKLRKLNIRTHEMVSAAVYGNLDPTGRFGVFSGNVIIPSFHTYRGERLEVYDTASELAAVDFDTNEVIPFPRQKGSMFRTFPEFSADGKAVYYCEAPVVELPDSIRYLKYSICRIPFDGRTGRWGERIDTVFSASKTGKSACYPRVSPDGRFLLYSVADYGTFPIWHPETDLQLLDLHTGRIDSLQVVNADGSDTYHSWSSSSRWFVFASKREDGMYGKPYFCYVDAQGRGHKPFLLPQENPARYDETFKSFNIPELATGPLPFDAFDIERVWHAEEAEQFRTRE